MITKQYSRSRGEGILSEQYTSDIYTINIDFLDNKINSLTIFARKYPYPDIIVDVHNYKNNDNPIHIDFSKIESIKYSDGEKLIKNLQYTLNFIKNELEPFLNNILT